MLFNTLLTVIALASSSVLAAPTSAEALKPWQLTSLSTFSPSGRPGSSPYSTLNATIKDPNTINVAGTPTGEAVFPPSSANCSAQWKTTPPWGKNITCTSDSTYSTWTFKILKGTSGTTNFTLSFNLVDDVTVLGTEYTKKFLGGDHFEVGTNLAGECGGSGVCYWGLKTSPYAIKQKKTQDSKKNAN